MARYDEEDLEELDAPQNPGIIARFATVAVFILLAVGIYFYLDSDKNTKDPDQLPLITESHAPEKTKPLDPGGMDIPHQDASVYEHLEKGTAAAEPEKLMPSSEAPIANVTAPPTTPANIPDSLPTLPAAPPQLQQTTAAPPDPAAAAAPDTKTAAADDGGDLAKIVQQESASQNQPSDVMMRIQLGAVSSQEIATREWQRMKTQYSDELKGLDVHYAPVSLAKGDYVRIQTETLAADDAAARCQKLKLEKQACMVVKASANE